LKEMWIDECRGKCASYWWITKAIPVGRYERCISECIKEKMTIEKPLQNTLYKTSNE
jgi:hypothetical protein